MCIHDTVTIIADIIIHRATTIIHRGEGMATTGAAIITDKLCKNGMMHLS